MIARAAVAIALAVGATACVSHARPHAAHAKTGTGVKSGAPGVQHGYATWYAVGKMTASGERFDRHAMTAAHRTLPFGTWVKVTHEKTGREVVVRINDRGPFGDRSRIIDLSEAAARSLGILRSGVAPVRLEVVRRGSDRR